MEGDSLMIYEYSYPARFFSISVTSFYSHQSKYMIEPKVDTNRPIYLPCVFCHGLALVWHTEDNWVLCNYLTGERRALCPHFSGVNERFKCYISGGIGYDRVTNDFKVVGVLLEQRLRDNNLKTIIYSLNKDEWHKIDDYPNSPLLGSYSCGVSVNGVIHWLAYINHVVVCIIALDLSTEKYRKISLPTFAKPSMDASLCMLNGSLIFSCEYDAWTLNDYGGEEIWTKFLSLQNVGISFKYPTKLLAYVKSKELVLIHYAGEGFLWYHLQTGCVRKVTVDQGLRWGFTSQVFPTSLIRLNGIKTEETLNMSRKRLKLEVTSDACV